MLIQRLLLVYSITEMVADVALQPALCLSKLITSQLKRKRTTLTEIYL